MQVQIRALLGATLLALVPIATYAQAPAAGVPPQQQAPAEQRQPATTPQAQADSDAGGRKGPGRGGPMAACLPDAQALCPGKVKGERRQCLDDNAAKLSPACAAAREAMAVRAKEVRAACRDDAKALCAGAGKAKGGEGIRACLTANAAKLSPACGQALEARGPKG